MRLEIKGEEALYNRFKRLNKTMQKTFWGLVRTDLQETLIKHTKKHYRGRPDSHLEKSVYAKKTDDGVEGGVRNDPGMMVTWKGIKINYARFVNEGTSAHDIAPKDKKALRWVGGNGRNFFSKGHRVSGITASNFIDKSAKETFGRLDEMFTEALKKDNVL